MNLEILFLMLVVSAAWIAAQLKTGQSNGILMLLEQWGLLFTHVVFVPQDLILSFISISNYSIQSLSILATKSDMMITMLHRKKDPGLSLLTVG